MTSRKVFWLSVCMASLTAHAQTNLGTNINAAHGLGINLPLEVSPKGGMAIPSSGLKQDAFLDKGWMGGLDISLPLLKPKKNTGAFSYDVGVEASIDYSSFTANGGLGYVKSSYQLTNGNIDPYFDNSTNKAQVLQYSVGPRLALHYKKIHLTPGIQLGYMNYRRNGYSILDTVRTTAGTKTTIPLLMAPENKTNGLIFRPKINVGYDVNKYVRVWMGAAFTKGPNINSMYYIWQPANATGAQKLTTDELANGKHTYGGISEAFKTTSLEFGIKVGLGARPLSQVSDKLPLKTSKAASIYKDKAVAATNNNIKKKTDGSTLPNSTTSNNNNTAPQQTYLATAPEISFPAPNSTTALVNNNLSLRFRPSNTANSKYILTIWTEKKGAKKEILKQTYPSEWDGIVKNFGDLIDKKDATVTYYAQVQAVPGDGGGGGYSDSIPRKASSGYNDIQQVGSPVFKDDGKTPPVAFSVSAGCFPELAIDLDSAKCTDSNRSKVWGHILLNNTSGITVTNITITDLRENTFSGATVPVSNVTPGYTLPPVNNTQFSFNVNKDMCGKKLYMGVLITYTCALTGQSVTVPCADTITMPCCNCNYCVDSMKIVPQNSTISYNSSNNSAQISQTISVTPINITNVTAEVVYMSDSVSDPACAACDRTPASVYHFTGTNTLSWNGNTAINASAANSAHTFPSKIISWTSNNNGSASFNLNVGLPEIPKLDCCERYTRICIRYSFTDANCKKCDILVCYSLTYTGNGK